MVTTTLLDLALELRTPKAEIRRLLNSYRGLPPQSVIPNEGIDATAVNQVREQVAASGHERQAAWALEPGDMVRRRAIHGAYGGQQQGGISTPRSIPDVLIFTDPSSGAKYGYDKFEGLKEDGTYAYTGEGQHGAQGFLRGNRALRDSALLGKTIRLLRTNGVWATYIGAFALGEPPYLFETIPDVDGEPRQGIIFNLEPIDARVELLPAFGGELPPAGTFQADQLQITTWFPPEYSDVVIPGEVFESTGDRVVSRVEFELQSSFGAWLELQGEAIQRLQLRAGSTMIEPDAYVPERKWIVEAKKSTARRYVREAIGQVLDYVHIARRSGLDANPVILLPGQPEGDLCKLISSLGITLIVRSLGEFEILEGK